MFTEEPLAPPRLLRSQSWEHQQRFPRLSVPVLRYSFASPPGVFDLTGALPGLPGTAQPGSIHALTWFSKESSHKTHLKLSLHGHTHRVRIWTQNMLFIVNFAKTHLSNKIYICEPLVLYITICYHSNKLNIHYLQQT